MFNRELDFENALIEPPPHRKTGPFWSVKK